MSDAGLGLVLEGGGMRAGFVAGALMAIMDMGLLEHFDTAVAVSASIPTLAYAAAGQRQDMEKVWREELNTPKLVCYKNIPAASLSPSSKRPVLDIDYLVFEVFK
ncbi:MAG: patatin-like phospholipase family protein, partial [Desulfobacteraceae bacterium]